MVNGIKVNVQGRRRIKFQLEIMHKNLKSLMPLLPTTDECFKFISFSGGFASVSFIQAVASAEPILELTAATLRIGEKQFDALARMKKQGRIDAAHFLLGRSCGRIPSGKSTIILDVFRKFVGRMGGTVT